MLGLYYFLLEHEVLYGLILKLYTYYALYIISSLIIYKLGNFHRKYFPLQIITVACGIWVPDANSELLQL
jgi:hypothetical protein